MKDADMSLDVHLQLAMTQMQEYEATAPAAEGITNASFHKSCTVFFKQDLGRSQGAAGTSLWYH